MKRQAGATLTLRLLLIFGLSVQLGLTILAEYLHRDQLQRARDASFREARDIAVRAAEVGPSIDRQTAAELLHPRLEESQAGREAAPASGVPADWRRDPRVFMLLDRAGRPARAPNGMILISSIGDPPGPIALGPADPAGYRSVDFTLGVNAEFRLDRPVRIVGVAVPSQDGNILVARAVARDWTTVTILILVGAALLAIVALLALLIAARFNRSMLKRVEAMVATLDRAEASGYRLRVEADEGGDELARLGGAINAMMERTAEATGHLRRIALHIAHDLRAPLRASLELVRRVETSIAALPEGSDLQVAGDQLAEVQRRCSQLLDIARVEAEDQSSFAPFDLAQDVHLLVEDLFEDLAAEKDCRLELGTAAAPVCGSRELIQRMLLNIFQNAVKFAEAGSTIGIVLDVSDATVRLIVSNRSPDIGEAMMRRIFEPDVSLQGGHGLGLPFVRAVARRHGGDAIAYSADGTFSIEVSLPRFSPG